MNFGFLIILAVVLVVVAAAESDTALLLTCATYASKQSETARIDRFSRWIGCS